MKKNILLLICLFSCYTPEDISFDDIKDHVLTPEEVNSSNNRYYRYGSDMYLDVNAIALPNNERHWFLNSRPYEITDEFIILPACKAGSFIKWRYNIISKDEIIINNILFNIKN